LNLSLFAQQLDVLDFISAAVDWLCSFSGIRWDDKISVKHFIGLFDQPHEAKGAIGLDQCNNLYEAIYKFRMHYRGHGHLHAAWEYWRTLCSKVTEDVPTLIVELRQLKAVAPDMQDHHLVHVLQAASPDMLSSRLQQFMALRAAEGYEPSFEACVAALPSLCPEVLNPSRRQQPRLAVAEMQAGADTADEGGGFYAMRDGGNPMRFPCLLCIINGHEPGFHKYIHCPHGRCLRCGGPHTLSHCPDFQAFKQRYIAQQQQQQQQQWQQPQQQRREQQYGGGGGRRGQQGPQGGGPGPAGQQRQQGGPGPGNFRRQGNA
jgi:hypothetical protein